MGLFGQSLSNDEYSLIYSHNFSIGQLSRRGGNEPSTDFSLIFNVAAGTLAATFFALMMCLTPWWLVAVFCLACLLAIVGFRLLTLLVYVAAVIQGKYTKKFYRSSVAFWGWWPFWMFMMTAVGALLGCGIGMYLWGTYLGPFFEYKKLQMYKEVNPSVVPSQRIQDGGLVDFVIDTNIDRSKGGCFNDKGDTYCVAPIVLGGALEYGLGGVPRTGSYDYFAVGKNCCACPNMDFQCGEWKNALAHGGLRSLDHKARPFFKLALDDWQANYQKKVANPQFFEWVESPEYVWYRMWNQTLYVSILTMAFSLSITLIVGLILDKMLLILWQNEIIVPRVSFAPAEGMEKITEQLLPRMYWRFQQEQAEIANMPVTTNVAEWKSLRGPGDKDSKDDKPHYHSTSDARNAMASSSMFDSLMAPPGVDAGSMRGMI